MEVKHEALEKQLMQAQKMEALGQLTGGIAHDFNNMLASILGFTSLSMKIADKEKPGSKLSEYLGMVQKSGIRARDLIAQMLAFSRTDTSIDTQQIINLDSTINEVVNMLKPMLPSSIEITTEIKDNTPAVRVDPVKINQVIMNLCINARDAMTRKGKIHILLHQTIIKEHDCSACHKKIAGQYVELCIRDNGSGIDPVILNRLFEPFFTTKEIGKGTGMGLSMVHGIVHNYNGHIIIESEANKGSAFRLLFPLATEDDNDKTKTSPAEEISSYEITDTGQHIMVVDDEESITRFIRELLEDHGYKVTTFTSSNEALQYFTSHKDHIDLVITDQTMPNMSGTLMANSMLMKKPNLPIIICTGYNEDINKEKVRDMGIVNYFEKPFAIDALLQAVHNLLQ